MSLSRTAAFCCLFSLAAALCHAGPRAVLVEEIRNERPSFQVRVSVDHADHVYKGGEVMSVSVTSGEAGYLYLLYCDASGEVSCLFPNKHQTDNAIPANRTVQVPARTSSFRLRVGSPYGEEVLKAVVTKQPLKGLEIDALTKGDVTPIDLTKAVRAVEVEYVERPAAWAEHDVKITTIDPSESYERRTRRVGLFVGISDFATVRDLSVCHLDAQQMASVMRTQGRLDETIVLTDEEATLDAIRNALRRLSRMTQAGDEVFVYWSGHGGRCSDDNGDEEDGYDEYLVPYDAQTTNLDVIRKTMLMDDTFGRWLQDFDGCKVVLILDACYSGGQSAAAKGLSDSPGAEGDVAFDFFTSELERGKDIGQKETAMLCSSQANEISFVRDENDLSVMTYYLMEQLKRDPQLTLPAAYESVKDKVARYVREVFYETYGETQTPTFYDNTTTPVYLKP